jgi:hypothetical protein
MTTRQDAVAPPDRPAHDSDMAERRQARFCRLAQSLGHAEVCPEEGCPFWTPGVEERQGHCAFDGLDLNGRKDLAGWLLDLRRELEEKGEAESDVVRSRFYRRLNDGRSD